MPRFNLYPRASSAMPGNLALIYQSGQVKTIDVDHLVNVPSLATVADLTALDVTEVENNSAYNVLGYHEAGDGGGGGFYYDENSAEAANGGTILAPDTGSGRWKRVYSGAVNVRWFGAKGDNATNDTAAIQAAITCQSSSGGIVLLPRGEYQITDTLSLPGLVSLIGDGMDSTVIRYTGSGIAISISGTSLSQKVKNMIRDMAVYGSASSTNGLYLNYAPYGFYENLRFYGFNIGVAVENSWDAVFVHVIGDTCRQDGWNFGLNANAIGMLHCMAFSNVRAGFFIEGSLSLVLTDCNSESNAYNVYISTNTGKPTEKISIHGGYYEGATNYEVFLVRTAGTPYPKAISVRDAYFVALAAGKQAIRVSGVETLLIDGCHFSDIGTAFDESLYLVDGGFSSGVIWGVGNLDESTNGIYKGAGMAYDTIDVTAG